jgi:hypothetical protein
MLIINSITDVITNSSTSVFVVHKESDINSIKELVNAVLSINGNCTFDDLFEISLELDQYTIERYLDDLSEEFNDLKNDNDWDKILGSYSKEKLSKLTDELWELIDNDYYWKGSPYEYIKVIAKNSEHKHVADLISRIDTIFDIDYNSDY